MTATSETPQTPRRRFRELLARPGLSIMPGGFSPLYARMAEVAGFESFFVAGSQTSAFLYGVPDMGLVGLRDMVDHTRHVQSRVNIPILVDADTGYGNATNAFFAVQEFVRAGVAGLQIEDQEAPKKSATMAGRRVIATDEAVGKIKAAIAARNELDPEFVVCARCDSIGAEGERFEDAVERAIAYVQDGGADFVWMNSVQTREQLKLACERIPAPVMVIWGSRPGPEPAELEQLGARIALYPTFAATVGAQAAWFVLNDFKARGPVALEEWTEKMRATPYGLPDQSALVGASRIRDFEAEFLPDRLQRDYVTTFGH
ncbi:MAG: isocitrate lyase/PEP mutase family protein [Chloroflexi bacterium]|nr:isocitrate lyase/PEP mutase family protein [Chloroflexota bacterium]